MATLSSGIFISQIYADNNAVFGGGTESDFDGDGNPGFSQNSDEFISIQNNSDVAVDVSGYEIYSSGVPYHTFPPGTVIQPGGEITVITNYNDPLGTPSDKIQQANAGDASLDPRLESGFAVTDTAISDNSFGSGATNSPIFGGDATVALFDGEISSAEQAILVNWEASGTPSDPASYNGGNGFNGEVVGDLNLSGVGTFPDAGTLINISDDGTGQPGPPTFPCFARGTTIETASGAKVIEELCAGDLVMTRDSGLQPIRWIGSRKIKFGTAPHKHKPIMIKQGCLGPGMPSADLRLSPQHRVPLWEGERDNRTNGREVLGLAKGLTKLRGVRRQDGCRRVEYYSILLPEHSIIFANDVPVESLYPGPWAMNMLGPSNRNAILDAIPGAKVMGAAVAYGPTALPTLSFQETVRQIDSAREVWRLMLHHQNGQADLTNSESTKLFDYSP